MVQCGGLGQTTGIIGGSRTITGRHAGGAHCEERTVGGNGRGFERVVRKTWVARRARSL